MSFNDMSEIIFGFLKMILLYLRGSYESDYETHYMCFSCGQCGFCSHCIFITSVLLEPVILCGFHKERKRIESKMHEMHKQARN